MKIALGSDHAGFKYKQYISQWLKDNDYQVLDFGAFSEDSVDYPDYAYPVSESVAANIADFGILICATGTGMSIMANKMIGIRAANCCSIRMASLARQHNNANILCLGARITEVDMAKKIILKFLSTDFEGGRHMLRVEKIHSLTGY